MDNRGRYECAGMLIPTFQETLELLLGDRGGGCKLKNKKISHFKKSRNKSPSFIKNLRLSKCIKSSSKYDILKHYILCLYQNESLLESVSLKEKSYFISNTQN